MGCNCIGAESQKINDVMDAAKHALKIYIDDTSDGYMENKLINKYEIS